jgi:hypothetical protein
VQKGYCDDITAIIAQLYWNKITFVLHYAPNHVLTWECLGVYGTVYKDPR